MNAINILAIDTTTTYLSIALQTKSGRSYLLEEVGNKQAEFILGKIQELLSKHNISVEDLNLIAYNEGPGSFTGLRIGLSVAMGIGVGLDIKLVPIPAFAIFANATKPHVNGGDVLVGLDARLKQIYLAGINTTTLDYFIAPQIIDPDKIEYIENIPLIGNGFSTYQSLLNSALQQIPVLSLAEIYPNALNMLDIIMLNKYPTLDSSKADLVYLRNKVALDLQEQHSAKKPGQK